MTTPSETSSAPETAKKPGKGKKCLSAIFNIAAGVVVTAAAKAIVAATMTWAAAPAVATLLVSSIAVGLASTACHHVRERRAAKKQGLALPKFWSKKNVKSMAKSSAFALIGGALFLGFSEGIIQGWFGPAQAEVPPAPVPPLAVVTPVEIPCPSTMDVFTDLVKDANVSDRVTDALNRAASIDPRIAAQGTKDLAFFAYNGFDGVPKDTSIALELFQKAADAGNAQAQVDLLYMQYHGLDPVSVDKQSALSVMQDIKNGRAGWFMKEWGGAGNLPHADFDSQSILKGVKLGCPR